MVTLLGSLLGFFSSMLPDILKLFQDRRDKRHELDIMDRQMELQKLGLSQRLEEIHVNADIAESQALYKTYATDIRWVDALNGTVRPVLAYAFFLLYATVKLLQILVAQEFLKLQLEELLPLVWNVEDQAIFAGIISFYFGSRAMKKLRGH